MPIPNQLIPFLHWIKEQTEAHWSQPRGGVDPIHNPHQLAAQNQEEANNQLLCEQWLEGAKWQGLSHQEIDAIEKEYQLKFTPAHRSFLHILHTVDKKRPLWDYDEEGEPTTIVAYESYFHNWKTDQQQIKKRKNWPLETIWQDITGVNKVWLKSWGQPPASLPAKRAILEQWWKQLPPCLPIRGHRFVLDLGLEDNPVLSIYGSDVVVYGWDMKDYLMSELGEELGWSEVVYDEEDACYYIEWKEEILEAYQKHRANVEGKKMAGWEEVINYWKGGASNQK